MRKKGVKVLLATMVCTMMIGATAFAQEKTMPDGTVFDTEYYAQSNPDVVAVLGMDENLLYQHYVVYGKNEGRKPKASVQNIPTMQVTEGYIGEDGCYVPSRDELMFPDNEQQDWRIYQSVCVKETAVKAMNGTLKRLPLGTVLKMQDLNKTGGYVAAKQESGKVIIVADTLLEGLAGEKREELLREMLNGELLLDYTTNEFHIF